MARSKPPPATRASSRSPAREAPKQRPHRPDELGPRIVWRGKYAAADLRPWGGERVTLRDPSTQGWRPEAGSPGQRTEFPDVARKWAQRYVDALRGATHRNQLGLSAPSPRLVDAVADFLAHRDRTVESNTRKGDETALKHLTEWVRDAKPEQRKRWGWSGEATTVDLVTRPGLQALFDDLVDAKYAHSTLATYRTSLGAFFTWLGGANPAREIELANPGTHDVETWTDDELVELRKAADGLDRSEHGASPSYRDALEVAVCTGAREQELFALQWTDFNSVDRIVRIGRQQTRHGGKAKAVKGKKPRTALVLPAFWDFYREGETGRVLADPDGGPCGRRMQNRIVRRILEEAGLYRPGVAWHRFRHTYARLCLEGGVSMEQLRKFLGHGSIRTTERYYDQFKSDVAARLAREHVYRDAGLRVLG